jgi:hypothetical protein
MGGGCSIAHRPPHAGTLPLDTKWSYLHLAGSLSLKGASVAVAFALLRRLPPLIETLRLQRSIGSVEEFAVSSVNTKLHSKELLRM